MKTIETIRIYHTAVHPTHLEPIIEFLPANNFKYIEAVINQLHNIRDVDKKKPIHLNQCGRPLTASGDREKLAHMLMAIISLTYSKPMIKYH